MNLKPTSGRNELLKLMKKKELRKAKRKTKLIKDIALLLALVLITFRWLFTVMNERKKAEIRENNETEQVIENLE